MKDIHYLVQELKDLLVHGSEMNLADLQYNAEFLYDQWNYLSDILSNHGMSEFDGEKEFNGLYNKLLRLYPIKLSCYNRDPETLLAEDLDLGLCSYYDVGLEKLDENELRSIQQEVTNYISKRSVCDPSTEDAEFADILIKQHPVALLKQDDMIMLAAGLKDVTHSFVQYIECNRPDRWRWSIDTINISQYLFELMVETTYKTIKGVNLDDFTYDIRHAFIYHQADVPDWLEKAINESVDSLENILVDTLEYIEKNGYHKFDYEAWLRPVFYNVGLFGIIFTLEQEPINQKK